MLRKPVLVVLTLLWSLLAAACGSDSPAPDRIQIDPSSAQLDFNEEVVLRAKTVTGSTLADAGPGVTWTSGDPTKLQVTVNADGSATVKGIGTGAATVQARLDDLNATANITVGAAPLTAIGVTPPSPSLARGTTVELTATGTYADNTTADVTATVTWDSDSDAIATVDSQGRVTGVGVGTTRITATSGAISGSTMVTVTAAELVSIAVTPTNPSVPRGRTQQLTATGTFTDNTTQNVTAMATWSSADTDRVTVNAAGLATGVGVGSAAVTATLDGISGSTTVTVTPAVLVSVAVTPMNGSIARGRVQQFAATGTYSDSSTQDLTATVDWSSSNPAVATVSNVAGTKGRAAAVDPGTTLITAITGAFTVSTQLTVTPAVLDTIQVTPATPSIADGRTQQFTATGIYSDTTMADLTQQVAWSSSNAAVATISNAAGTRGLATGESPGTTTITAASGVVSGTATLTVTDAVLVSIGVTPAAPSVAKGLTRQFTATGTFSNGSTANITDTVTWASSAPAVATVSNAAGSRGLATTLVEGNTQISATSGAITGSTTLTVTAAELVSIGVTPAAPSLPDGQTLQFTATGTYTDLSTQNLTTAVTWSTSVPAVASVSNAAGERGLVTALAPGATNVVATLGAISGSTQLTVTPAVLVSIDVQPANGTVTAGLTFQLSATGTYSDATTNDITALVTWTSSDDTIATVSNAAGEHGLASGVAAGQVTVSATLDGVTGDTGLTVVAAILESIEVVPANETLALGSEQAYQAFGTYDNGQVVEITGDVTWASTDELIAVVSNDPASKGLVTALAVGDTTISATLDGITGQTGLTVSNAIVVAVEVSPVGETLALGRTLAYSALAIYSDQSTLDITETATWGSADESVAVVSNEEGTRGLVTSLAVGATTISASFDGVTGDTALQITPAALESITIDPLDAPALPAGTTRDYTATGTFSDGTNADLTTQVTWSSSDETVAVVSNAAGSQGQVTGLAGGTATLTAELDGVTGTRDVEVSQAIVQSIEVTPADSSIAIGVEQNFTATATFSDLSVLDVTEQVTWSSSDENLVLISNAAGQRGLALGFATGTVVISAELSGVTGSTNLTITDAELVSLEVTPVLPSIALGRGLSFTLTGIYTDGSSLDHTEDALWSSSNEAVATISNVAPFIGRATSVAEGVTTITASYNGQDITTDLTVTPVALEEISVTPELSSVPAGRTVQLTATGFYSDGSEANITADVTWTSDNQAIATVSNVDGTEGLVMGEAVGLALITAELDGVSFSGLVEVTAAVLEGVTIDAGAGTVPVGRTLELRAFGEYSDGSSVDITEAVTWETSTGAIVSVTNQAPRGVVTGLALGTGAITATDPDTMFFGEASVEVTAAVLDSIAVTPSPVVLGVGMTQQLTATGTYSDGTERDITNDADTLWASANEAVAVVSNAAGAKGGVTGVASGGPIDVTATQQGITGTATITVPAMLAISSISPANEAIGVGFTSKVVVTFSLAMAPATITAQAAAGACSGSIQVSQDDFATCLGLSGLVMSGGNTIATATPVGGLPFGAYKVRVTTAAQAVGGASLMADVTQATGFSAGGDTCGNGLVISQVYGGGGNVGATYLNDFIELKNTGAVPVSTNGLHLQFVSANGAGNWAVQALPDRVVPPGGYFLVQEAANQANGVALPAPDFTPASPFAIGGTSGKVALTSNNTPLVGGTLTAAVVDMVGFGAGLNAFEGTAGAPAPSNSTSVQRLNAGCVDRNTNNADFVAATPIARNSASPAAVCACNINETGNALEMDFCKLQHPPSTSAAPNVATEDLYARVYEDGFTQGADGNPAITAQIGYGPAAGNPLTTASQWLWTNAVFNVQVGNDDEYKANLTVPAAGSYRYTSRFSRDGRHWTVCDLDGAGANAGLTFDLPMLGELTIAVP